MDTYAFAVLLTLIMIEAFIALALYIEGRIYDIITRKKIQLAELLMQLNENF